MDELGTGEHLMGHQRRTRARFMRTALNVLLSAIALVASLALATPATQAVTATIPAGLLTTTQLAVGDAATCAITTQQTIACWGYPGDDLLFGDGIDYVRRATPTAGSVLEGKAITKIRAGGGHFCALAVDETFACWGRNTSGQLGDGTTTTRLRPVAVSVAGTPLDGKVIKDFSLGQRITCAVSTDNVIACWGTFYG